MTTYGGGSISPFLTSELDGGESSASYHCHFNPRETVPTAYHTGYWLGPTACLDIMEKRKITYPWQECDSSLVQAVA
jgi:hypothetical protein